ncbi:phosphate ABC transporter ATP-binding protein [Rubritalea sp.]|uniref:ABC transporter ATP-binding protein n=1 Tax=Rubritalea sp. TaxID=2109375 RepID=UPI003242ED83
MAKEATVLDHLSHTIIDGKINALIGPSGCGKSTLLRCLNRFIEPTLGTILMDGEHITDIDVLTLRARVAMVMQSATMFDGSIADNLAFGPRSLGQLIDRSRMTELLELVSLDPSLLDKEAKSLSGGQAQRVSIARALANNPEVLLLDEPTSALDPAATRTIEKTLTHLSKTLGMTIVLVSHSMEQVARIADTSALILNGKIIETGTPEHLLSGGHHHWTEQFAKGELNSQQ